MGKYGDNFYEWLFGKEQPVCDGQVMSLMKHDQIYHGGHYDPKTQECKLRDALTEVDNLGNPTMRDIPSYKDLKEMYEEQGVSSDLVDAAGRLYLGILEGEAKPKRIPADVFQGEEGRKMPLWLTLAYLVGSNYGDDDEAAKQVVLDFAEAAECRYEDIAKTMRERHGEPFSEGMEAEVFDDGKYVEKISSLGLGSTETLQKQSG